MAEKKDIDSVLNNSDALSSVFYSISYHYHVLLQLYGLEGFCVTV